MRIALRTSGGRGEYELAGSHGLVAVGDLVEHRLRFELTPEIAVDSHSFAQRVQGKPRIRLDDTSLHRHGYRVLAAALLLPKPKRELRAAASDADFVRDGKYSITDIDVDVASVASDTVDLRPTRLWLRNATGLSRDVDVAQRMALVQGVWDAARGGEGPLHDLVGAHEKAVVSGDHRTMEAAAAAIRAHMASDRDILDTLAARLGVAETDATVGSATQNVPLDSVEDETNPKDAVRRNIARWRWAVVRSASGRAFSRRVREAYGDRCALSGEVLPKLSNTASPGVDGAHILPWARYELNTLRNGICLNKLCHWAFDAGVIRIDFDGSSGAYRVSMAPHVEDEGSSAGMTLDYFRAMVGQIPPERLPASSNDWPSPAYLAQLNAEMFGGAAG